jgi:hypothetical protein
MSNEANEVRRTTSPTYEFFHTMFEGADLISSFWQPGLKGLGRGQLELATLNARQSQAFLHWGRSIATATSPADVMSANLNFWQTSTSLCADASQRLTASLSVATQPPHAFEHAFELVPLPVARRIHDTLVISDEENAKPRKVA